MPKSNPSQLRHLVSYQQNWARAAAAGEPEPRPVPTKPGELTWRDYLIMLLHIGAELEHGLMVQYLYAAYSLGGDGVPPEDQAKVREWQDLILTVAREEMGHLLTVQNVLCLVGGPVSFNREEFPWEKPFYPFRFQLEPLSKRSLAAYIFAEMPGTFEYIRRNYQKSVWGEAAKHFVEHDLGYVEETVGGDGEARPVGVIYQMIIDIISDPEKIPDSDFRPETYPFQASWDDWGRSYGPKPTPPSGKDPKFDNHKANVIIERAATRTEALHALREILGQGEASKLKIAKKSDPQGPPAPDGELSHFERFVAIFQAFEKKRITAKWNPVRRVPVNPTTVQMDIQPGSSRSASPFTPITAKASRTWAKLFNVRYRMLLTYLTHTFRHARAVSPNEPNTRGAVMARIFGEMYNIKTIAGILVAMPLTDKPGDPRRAGPPFEMPYTLELPLDDIDCWRLHRDIVISSQQLCKELLNPADDHLTTTPPAGEPYLRALCNHDQKALEWIDLVLGGLREKGGTPA